MLAPTSLRVGRLKRVRKSARLSAESKYLAKDLSKIEDAPEAARALENCLLGSIAALDMASSLLLITESEARLCQRDSL